MSEDVFKAYCWRTGLIGFCNGRPPVGTKPLGFCADKDKLTNAVIAISRHAKDGVDLLVPGVPEADTDDDAFDAVIEFINRLQERLSQ